MTTRRQAAQILDIPLEMAVRHGIPAHVDDAELARLQADPPGWLAQSRANRTGKRPVWVQLTCTVCGHTEAARPKKWWPEFTFLACEDHSIRELPELPSGAVRSEYPGVGSRFIGVVDAPVEPPAG
ncbi:MULTISPECIES: hypothetical protein [unclassified Arthrobacter]|uniref:hypothetical protein n=1 Tax=unclassified Arthrobacter TaxID=235627 RepID=UPI001E5EE161|nr:MULTISPECIES: hypothetical protein [unclassified Arthrobacter]MCC9146490.1 hypothetical protein [Arthrobacter sp. zg-Y919]MDK1277720.1 hypothetical protein [Arthrobacter sp. zg.Y919]WIB02324.1 hypothetical protein QNO10_10155 [Arthrobacter sp. zg-Y919]